VATEADPIGPPGGAGSRGAGGRRPRVAGPLRALGWLAFATALGFTFSLYLRPGLVLDFGMILEMCGLR
jgi:hypothetical protein